MSGLNWSGHLWELHTPRPTAARHFAGLATSRDNDATTPMTLALAEVLGAEQIDTLEDGILDGRFPPNGYPDLLTAAIPAASGRPIRAVVALSQAAVSQWSIIRGRLVKGGIADPLRDLPTLWALLDAVETMILESKSDEKEAAAYWRSLYPADSGWSDSDEAAAADAFFGAFG